MGQNSSSAFQNSSQPLFSRRKINHPLPPPVVQPVEVPVPQTPNHVVAENRVLPNGLHDMGAARKLLRPISQELTKFHPEYADIFPPTKDTTHQDGDDSFIDRNVNMSVTDKENSSLAFNTSSSAPQLARMPNGRPNRILKPSVSNDSISSSYKNKNTSDNFMARQIDSADNKYSFTNTPDMRAHQNHTGNLTRSQSIGTDFPQPGKTPKHKRQTSLASGIALQENVIMEDPREHLYNAARNMPFSNFQPSTTSLPIKSTFDMNYSMNVTYAQLAEHRRINRTSELEERTGKKLEELGEEISASSTVPKSPFDLQNLGGKSSTHSISTGSSDTGVSKSKKKRAPPPPLQPTARYQSIVERVTSEPRIGYDMKDSSSVSPQNHGKPLQRSISSASRSSKRPAPQPLPKSISSISLQGPASTVVHPVPYSETLPTSSATLPRPASSNNKSSDESKRKPALATNVAVQQSISEARAQLEALKKLQDTLRKQEPTDMAKKEHDISDASNVHTADVVADLMNIVDAEAACDDNGNTIDKDNIFDLLNQPTLHQTDDFHRSEVHHTEVQKTEGHGTQLRETSVHETEEGLHQTGVIETEVHQVEVHKTEVFHTNVRHSELRQTDMHQTPVTALDCQSEKHSKDLIVSATGKEPILKMSSVLQRDIILAAQTRSAKADIGEQPSTAKISKIPSDVREKALSKTVIAGEEKRKDISLSERNADHYDTSISNDDRSVIFQSDLLKVVKKPVISNDDNPTSTRLFSQIEIENTKLERTKSLSSVGKIDEKPSQQGSDVDQEDRSSAGSMDFSKRSSIQSEDMSISSSNTSQRVFSPDWAPEHDLDSDDDIMDESYTKAERRISSEGFKPSIIPPKLRDLKESKTEKSSKQNKKQNEKRETELSLANEKTKFGSIRKFKKSVHQSMKSAFGSISKASGALMNRQKSQDFLDNREAKPSADIENDISASLRNHNWTLSNSRSGSLRSSLSDGFVSESHLNQIEHSQLFENSDDEVGDVDFADGINDISTPRENSSQKTTEEQKTKMLKRTGVAYMSGKGQIIILPEYHTVQVDETGRAINGSQENEGHAPKMHKKKEKKYAFESTLRVQDKYKIEEVLARMISEKEQEYEIERLRQQEMESNFRRRRISSDLQAEERIQRLQKNNIQEKITQLQQQQLVLQAHNEMNNNAINVPSLNSLNSATNVPGLNTTYVSTDNLSFSAPYLVNGNTAILQTGYVDSFTQLRNTLPVEAQLRYSMPSFLTAVLGQTFMPNAFTDPVNYLSHPTSFVGGSSVAGGFGSTTTVNLTPQDLAYLSEYMRMMGVPPPTNQQQWAVLLGTVNYNATRFPTVGQTNGQGAFTATASGPDLSYIFGNGKNLDVNLTTNTEMQALGANSNQQSFQPKEISSLQQPHGDSVTIGPSHFHNSTEVQPLHQQPSQLTPTTHNYINDFDIKVTKTNIQPQQDVSSAIATKSSTDQTVAVSVIESGHHHSTPEEKINNLTSTNVNEKADSNSVNSQTLGGEETIPTQNTTRTRFLPAKVYGPIGFRPVSFHPGSSR